MKNDVLSATANRLSEINKELMEAANAPLTGKVKNRAEIHAELNKSLVELQECAHKSVIKPEYNNDDIAPIVNELLTPIVRPVMTPAEKYNAKILNLRLQHLSEVKTKVHKLKANYYKMLSGIRMRNNGGLGKDAGWCAEQEEYLAQQDKYITDLEILCTRVVDTGVYETEEERSLRIEEEEIAAVEASRANDEFYEALYG